MNRGWVEIGVVGRGLGCHGAARPGPAHLIFCRPGGQLLAGPSYMFM